MKINWNRWFIRDRGQLLFGGFLACVSSLVFLYMQITQPKIKNDLDLQFISGTFKDYSFIDGSRGYHNYTFRLNPYLNSFKVKADFLFAFNDKKFKNLNFGDTVILTISKDDIYKINSNAYIFIFSAADSRTDFLNLADSLKKHNSYQLFYISGAYFLLGLVMVFFGYKPPNKIENV